MQRTLNLKVKYRESFRPFAPSVLREEAFEPGAPGPGEDPIDSPLGAVGGSGEAALLPGVPAQRAVQVLLRGAGPAVTAPGQGRPRGRGQGPGPDQGAVVT